MRSIPILALSVLAASDAFAQYRRGVDLSGAEWGQAGVFGVLGQDYFFQHQDTFQYFGQKNLGLIRFALAWERLQPTLGGPLDPDYLADLQTQINWASQYGGAIIIDVHNYARYTMNVNGTLQTYVIDNPAPDGTVPVTRADLADLWTRLSTEFKYDGGVYAYGMMNEPHDMGTANWEAISQTVLSAIRANQDDKLVLVPGNSWSTGNSWPSVNGPTSWIQDPAQNFLYEAHVYFDSDGSGTYASGSAGTSYDNQVALNPSLPTVGQTRVSHFISWCQQNNVGGIVDEYGVPDDDPRWLTVLDNFFVALDAAQMDGVYWAAGEYWGNYILSVQPTNNFSTDRPQMAELVKHLAGRYLTALSAASVSVARSTSGSLVTLWGNGFTDQTATAAAPYPQSLDNVTVQVTDASGASTSAGLVFVSPGQINLQMPAGLALGRATLTVSNNGSQVASGGITITAEGPAIFTANTAGYGVAAAQVVRTAADLTQTYEPVATFDATQNQFVAMPISFGAPSDQQTLVLYGTGIGAGPYTAQIGGVSLPVAYAGPQNQYPGLDQANINLPRSFAGAGQVNVVVTSGGVPANTVTITFQ
jgi:endoglucanase